MLLASCAAPSLVQYTLDAPGAGPGAAMLARQALVIEVIRVSLPDDLDTQDIQVRRGNVLQSSARGRWASRLSAGATHLLTNLLSRRRPNALFTDQQQAGTPSYRIVINISRLDVSEDGTALLEADWQIVPGNPALPVKRDRASLRAVGSAETDSGVVALTAAVLGQLAGRIDVGSLR